MRRLTLLLGLLAMLISGCGGNTYGYARTYAPLGDEVAFLQREQDLSYQDVIRFPDRYADQVVGWFGVVTAMEDAGDGLTQLRLDLRVHQERHLCQDETDASCRVTVSARTIGPFLALVEVRPEDRDGPRRLWTGSLVKIYGTPTGHGDEEHGPSLRTLYYRHWPHGTFVTTTASGSMRQ
ncbi:MAG: hypothetical protein K8H88_05725 [Sandaracinaceae bacterium]|nr:hypothetical protein [Sandaracinaceae bacterium]